MAFAWSSLVGQSVVWTPTSLWKDRYDLLNAKNRVLASLEMKGWRSSASASVPEGRFVIEREGIFRTSLFVYANGESQSFANLKLSWSGKGTLQLANGRTLIWKRLNFWGTRYAWMDGREQTSFVECSTQAFSRKVTIELTPAAATEPELSLLLTLGLYLIIQIRRQAAAASSSASN